MRLIFLMLVSIISTTSFSQEWELNRLYAELGSAANDTIDANYINDNNCVILKSEIVSAKKQNNYGKNVIYVTDMKEYEISKLKVSSTKSLDGMTVKNSDSNCLSPAINRFFIKKNKVFIEAYLTRNGKEIKEPLMFYLVIK